MPSISCAAEAHKESEHCLQIISCSLSLCLCSVRTFHRRPSIKDAWLEEHDQAIEKPRAWLFPG